MPAICIESPVGPLTIVSDGSSITRVTWSSISDVETSDAPELSEAADQLAAYFDGRLQVFDLPLNVQGGPLQQAVCDAMLEIPFGETKTYGDIGKQLEAAPQAIGQACGGNPIPVIIPCHRVLGATSLGGFSGQGGIETKVWLLRHEGAAGLLI